jgi:hypothetical protein
VEVEAERLVLIETEIHLDISHGGKKGHLWLVEHQFPGLGRCLMPLGNVRYPRSRHCGHAGDEDTAQRPPR